MTAIVAHRAVRVRRRCETAEERERPTRPRAEDDQAAARAAREIEVTERRAVADDVEAGPLLDPRDHPSVVRDVERSDGAFETGNEEEPARLIERDVAGRCAAVGPLSYDRPAREIDRHRRCLPVMRVRAP